MHQLGVSLEDLYNGITRKLALQKNVICGKCEGKKKNSGFKPLLLQGFLLVLFLCLFFFKKQQGGGLGIKFVGEWGIFIFLPYTPQVYQGIFFLFMLICSDIKLLF